MNTNHRHTQACIDACIRCAQACESCANSCLFEPNVHQLAECIRLDRDCATLCWATATLLSRDYHFLEDLCRVCADICYACAAECERHPHQHCGCTAKACRACAEECRRLAGCPIA